MDIMKKKDYIKLNIFNNLTLLSIGIFLVISLFSQSLSNINANLDSNSTLANSNSTLANSNSTLANSNSTLANSNSTLANSNSTENNQNGTYFFSRVDRWG